MNDCQVNLIAYGTHLLASQLGQPWPFPESPLKAGTMAATAIQGTISYHEDKRLRLARKIVHDRSLTSGLKPVSQAQPVVPVFELLSPALGVTSRDWMPPPFISRLQIPRPESLEHGGDPARPISPSHLWNEFWSTMQRLSDQSQFETFFFFLARYGWNLPGTIADGLRPQFENGISVFEQFKAVVALSHCLNPESDEEQPICMVAGDIPGVQRMLYTITSKGAAKTLRGRSAYLSLLSDALVRLVLRHFDLPCANVVFGSSGNFLIAAPAKAEEQLDSLDDAINGRLLDLHRGELYLGMAGIKLPAHLYADSGARTEPHSLAERRAELLRRLEASKQAAFAKMAKTRYSAIFEPMGDGGGAIRAQKDGNLCEMCHTEVGDKTREFVEDPEAPEGPGTVFCEQCHSFAYSSRSDSEFEYDSLAWSVANAEGIFVSTPDVAPQLQKYADGKGNPPWNVALSGLGLEYRFIKKHDAVPPGLGTFLAFDPDQSLPMTLEVHKSYGFRFLSRLTPREDPPANQIRDFHLMAREDAIGIHRYGVLRMDVDSLGETISGGNLRYPDLLHFSALSNSLDYFFGGMLDQIGRDCLDAWQMQAEHWHNQPVESIHKWPYVIYAGGDDLFIVAAWDLLPPLAQAIQQEFTRFCLNRLTISGGIAIAREKYPLYRAAEQAGLALEQSKDHEVRGRNMLVRARKNALTFLGLTLDWDEVARTWDLTERLVMLLSGDAETHKAPRALLQMLNRVAWLYRRETPLTEPDSIKLGPWLWALHYGLRRMLRRVPDSIKAEVARIPNQILGLDEVGAASEKLRQLEKKRAGGDDLKRAERELQEAIHVQVNKAREAWPTIRYLGLPVRWAEFLTRKEV